MKLVKKITVKGIIGDIKKLTLSLVKDGEIADGQKIELMRVVGKCNRFEIKTNDYGESLCLKGQFQAINKLTGEETRAGTCYMPDTASEAVAGMLQGEIESVEFAFDIAIVTDASSLVGYVYEVTPLIEPTEDDAMNRLTSSLPDIPKLDKPAAKK